VSHFASASTVPPVNFTATCSSGLSIEGSVVLERQDANCSAYGDDYVTSKKLLTGAVPVPPWASGLIETLERSTGAVKGWIEEEPRAKSPDDYAFRNGVSSESSRPKFKRFFSSSNNTVKKATGKPLASGSSNGNNPKKANPADRYLDTPRKSYEGGIAAPSSLDDGVDEPPSPHDERGYDPFYASDLAYRASVTSRSDSLFSEPFSNSANEETGFSPMKTTGAPRFLAHFESDFDPTAPPPVMQIAHRASPSISSLERPGDHQPVMLTPNREATDPTPYTQMQSDDDPFGIFNEPPSSAPIPPNLAYNARQLQQSQQQTQHQSRLSYDRPTPALTSSSSVPSPTSPTFSQSSRNYNPSITSPKPVRQLSVKRSLNTPVEPGVVRAIALYDFNAQEVRFSFCFARTPLSDIQSIAARRPGFPERRRYHGHEEVGHGGRLVRFAA
jgi:hypothetical protein